MWIGRRRDASWGWICLRLGSFEVSVFWGFGEEGLVEFWDEL